MLYSHATVERISAMTVEKKNETVLNNTSKKAKGNDKRRLLAVLEIMKRTDEEHPLTKNQIMDKVVEQGIEVNNLKTIAADLAALKELDYDIVTDYSGSYMVGGQLFENYELKILADNIANARYLTEQHSQELIDRIKKLASESGEELIVATTVMDPKLKSSDGKMKYKLDTLFRCIQKKKKVQFSYKKPGASRAQLYTVNPYALTIYEDEYYLTAAFDSGKGYSDIPFNFKVQRMTKVEETELPVRNISEIKILADGLGFADIQSYRRLMKNMWSGAKAREVVLKVQLHLADSKLVLSADRVKENEEISLTIFTKVIINTGFYQTLARYGNGVEIIQPEEARQGYVEYLKSVLQVYGKDN